MMEEGAEEDTWHRVFKPRESLTLFISSSFINSFTITILYTRASEPCCTSYTGSSGIARVWLDLSTRP
ncbi:hypothetical protein EJ06DRAFT_306723 [Trichodelitschia bisporula]|uniref:Uncharacterized protein n=1 Tax=Trichodelitschia bisporula TaxID=703511 RepID=A0A6G1I333_9PEZI|nr:hypothetical protein EJ06DRAFT_306723 [Trichodelitschia bisporula]